MTYGQFLVAGGIAFVWCDVCTWLRVFYGPRHERVRNPVPAIGAPVALVVLYLPTLLREVRNGSVKLDSRMWEQWTVVIMVALAAMMGISLILTARSVRQARERTNQPVERPYR